MISWISEYILDLNTPLNVSSIGFVLGIISNYWGLMHAPDSKNVVNSVFVGKGGSCYELRPIIVPCP